jgi:hypothetical protein
LSDLLRPANGDFYDTGDESAVNKARIEAGRAQREAQNFLAAVMDTAPGRAWIYRHLADCNIWMQTFLMGSPDGTAFNEGRRSVGLRLLDDIMTCAPERYMTMIAEAAQK